MRRRRKRKTIGTLTPVAREVWKLAYPGESWPSGWRVEWVGFMRGARGLCIYRERRILLSYGDHTRKKHPADIIATLVHELIHVRAGHRFRHGKDFRRLERLAMERIDKAGEVTNGA